jgi:hypothetical protein
VKRIYVASPLSAPTVAGIQKNVRRVWSLCRAVIKEGHAPFASHGFYTAFLDDTDPYERAAGTAAGLSWMLEANELWVFTKAGISPGMQHEIREWNRREDGAGVVYDPLCWAGIE